MKTKTIDNTKLGLFVLAGVLFLIVTLYMIGKNRNLFGSTFTMKAVLSNVNGLVAGNNVRFKGIDVGTVKSITLLNDSSIYVTLTIDNAMKPYIKQNAMASVGTDGLMGNKLVNINSVPGKSPTVEEGSVIQSLKPIETDEMLRTLSTTNENLERISHNLREVTVKLNTSSSLWNLLSDTVITYDLRNGVKDFRRAGSNLADLTYTTNLMINRFNSGSGLAGTIFTDTTLSEKLSYSLNRIQEASDRTSLMMENLESVIAKLKEGEGTAGLLLSDTTLRNTLLRSGQNVEEGTGRFNENMEAMRSNFLFRGYFKKLEKEEKKAANAAKDN
ncbi:MAG: MlaD family protein [Cyclobacteriaceae bacterium]|nr:MlaD family protein [Cyclobacteriaceae bacterium]MDH4296408.1 MlaD family protein [Cyclobacteriaceae bacterium]MDH5248829.1 MlaD family protein [Cyclobacteriaceae bacterium]